MTVRSVRRETRRVGMCSMPNFVTLPATAIPPRARRGRRTARARPAFIEAARRPPPPRLEPRVTLRRLSASCGTVTSASAPRWGAPRGTRRRPARRPEDRARAALPLDALRREGDRQGFPVADRLRAGRHRRGEAHRHLLHLGGASRGVDGRAAVAPVEQRALGPGRPCRSGRGRERRGCATGGLLPSGRGRDAGARGRGDAGARPRRGCAGRRFSRRPAARYCCARIASSRRATMLVILIIGFTAGPAVSL